MADREDDERGEVIESKEATAGGAQELDTSATLMRADEAGLLPPAALDQRQRKLRRKRLQGGPSLGKAKAGPRDTGDAADVEPTETEEPPS